MEPFTGFLLAMQAAGTVIDWWDAGNQSKFIQMGRQLEKAGIEMNIEAARLESADASLQEMKQLRQNIGSQVATQAARGTSSGAGTALTLQNESVSNFNRDERMRRLNLLSREADLRAQNVLSGMHTLRSETQLGRQLAQRTFDRIPVSSLSKKFGFGLEPA